MFLFQHMLFRDQLDYMTFKHGEEDIRKFEYIFHYPYEYFWLSRYPIEVSKIFKVLAPFQGLVWTFIIIAPISASLIFIQIAKFYKKFIPEMIKSNIDFGLIILQTCGQLVEPMDIKWFKRINFGKVLLGLWSFYCLLLVMFYNCNLRSSMIKPAREPFIDNSEDVLNRGKPIHLLHIWYKSCLCKVG